MVPDEAADTVWLSDRSTSVKAIVPVPDKVPAGVAASVIPLVKLPPEMTGASLVPVTVTSIWRVTTPP
ncbi:hypothetical protein CFIICLFH_3830 [Methylobacterium goesingense]|nr:hypothetical protein CFIICLFH_3830 [Methylobacterium goesingense]